MIGRYQMPTQVEQIVNSGVGCIRGNVAMSDAVASQLICDDLSGFTAAHPEQSLEEAHCCLSISATL